MLEVETKEAQLRTLQTVYTLVLSRLEGLEVSDETKALFQRFVNGELTVKQLSSAIDDYLNLKTRSGPT